MTDIDMVAVKRLEAIDLSIMLACATCPDECNCHPPSEMWIINKTGNLICDGCASDADIPAESLSHAPDPVRVIRGLSVCLTDAEASEARLIDQLHESVAQSERNAAIAMSGLHKLQKVRADRDSLAKACDEWAETSQRNYQRAKAAEAERDAAYERETIAAEYAVKVGDERDRLRAALAKIENGLPAGSTLLDSKAPAWRDAYRDMQRIARAALERTAP